MKRSGMPVMLLFLLGSLIVLAAPNKVLAYDLSFYLVPTTSGTFYSLQATSPGTLSIASQARCLLLQGSTDSCPTSFTVSHTLKANGVNVGTNPTQDLLVLINKVRPWVYNGTYTSRGIVYDSYTRSVTESYSLPDHGSGLLETREYTFSLQISGGTETAPNITNIKSTAPFAYTVYSGGVEYAGSRTDGVITALSEGTSSTCSGTGDFYFPNITVSSASSSWWNATFADQNLCAQKIARTTTDGFSLTDLQVVTSLNISNTPVGPDFGYAISGQATGTEALSTITVTASGTLPKQVSLYYDLMKGSTRVKRVTRNYTAWHLSGDHYYFTAGEYPYPMPSTGAAANQMQTATNYKFSLTATDASAGSATSPVVSTLNFKYTVFSGNLDFNQVATTFTSANYYNAACTGGDYALYTVAGTWPNLLGGQSPYSSLDLLCTAQSQMNTDGSIDLILVSGTADVGTVSGTTSGMDFSLTNVKLNATGGVYNKAVLTLPETVTAHIWTGTEVWPRGSRYLSFPGKSFAKVYNDSSSPFEPITTPLFFHGNDLPFYVYDTKVSLDLNTTSGLVFEKPAGSYVHASATAELADTDLRKSLGLPSNDIIFARNDASQAAAARITGAGIHAQIPFEGSPSSPVRRTSFPQTFATFSPWTVFVENGVITSKSELAAPGLFMRFNRDCPPSSTCGEKGGKVTYAVNSDKAGLLPSGTFGAQFASLGDPTYPAHLRGVEWGGFEGEVPTFARRDNNTPGVWVIPGFIMPETSNTGANRRISQVLLGSVLFDTPYSPLSAHLLNDPSDPTARNGDGFFAGINLGPEILVGNPDSPSVKDGIGSVLNRKIDLRFYGNTTPTEMGDRESTKYVLRPGGLTGVFNTAFSASTAGPVSIYNYNLYFSRFSFRQDRNRLDGDTFIDGQLTLNGPVGGTKGMPVGFRSLDLTCNGNLANGDVDTEPEPNWAVEGKGNGIDDDNDNKDFPDEGCQTLDYWNMPILYKGMAFANDPDTDPNTGDCPTQPKKLQMTTANYVDGIKAPLTMTSLYPPDGTLENQTVTGPVDTWFDRSKDGSKPGFNLRLQKAYLNQISASRPAWEGFMNLAGLTDVPLFNDAKLSGHFANNRPDDLSDYSLFVFKDETDADLNFDGVPDDYGTNVIDNYRKRLQVDGEDQAKPHFSYSWPTSSMVNLDYYANYTPATTSDMPQFLGIKKDTDVLSVIRVNSVPDYINPQRTKFSFGASADIAALANFQVDLNNLPGGLDDFLHNSLDVDGNFSIEGILGNLVSAEQIMHDLTGGDLTDLFGDVIDQALQVTPVDNAITEVCRLLNEAHQAPYQIIGALIDPLEDANTTLVNQINGSLTTGIDDLYNKYAAFVVYDTSKLKEIYAAQDPLDTSLPGKFDAIMVKVEKIRGDLITAVDTIDNTVQKLRAAVNVLGGAQGKIHDIKGAITQAQSAINTLKSALNSNLAGLMSNTPSNNPLLSVLQDAKGTVANVKNQIKAINLGQIGQALQTAAAISGSSLDTSMLDSAEETINTAIDQLEDVISQADSSINNLYASLPLSDLLNQINTLLAPTGLIQQSLTDLSSALDQVDAVLASVTSLAEGGLTTVSSHLATLGDALQNQKVPDPTAGLPDWNAVQGQGQAILDNLALSLVSSLPGGNLEGILSSLAGQDFLTVFRDSLADILLAPINQILDDYGPTAIRTQLEIIVANSVSFLPNPTPQDIRNMIRSQIMNTGAVEEINELFYEQFGFVSDLVDDVAAKLTDQINSLIRQAIAAVNEGLSQSLAGVSTDIGADAGWSGIKSVGIDGYAIVSQDEVEKIHMEAEFEMDGDPDPTSYNAALDVTLWNADNGKSACAAAGSSNYDVTISTHDVKADMLGLPVGIKTASLGFSMQGSPDIIPLSVFGNVYLLGEINFEALILEDLGLESGLGIDATPQHYPIIYFGATGAGRFQDYSIPKAAFYLGRTCDFEVLRRLDPEAAEFIGEITPLTGVYARGSVDVPIYNMGCMFTIGVGADIGVWYFTNPSPGTYGGLVGGSAYGQLACLASLKGKITTMGQKSGSKYKFHGDGWAAAGVGSCSPSKWKKVSDARKDSWCLTGDAQFGAEYDNGWDIDGPNVNCCD